MKKSRNTGLCVAALFLILSTVGCVDIFGIRSNIEVIPEGKGIQAPGFKSGTYKDFSDKPQETRIRWDEQAKEYEIQMKDSDASRFRLLKLRRQYYLLQSKEEDHFNYVVINIHGDIVDFLNLKEDNEEKVKKLMKKYGLEKDAEDNVIGTRDGLTAFFKTMVKKKYLTSGEQMRYIGER
ncbi:MAG: hypothetical protein GTO45_08085 [Candidatus Aminicenantes bacterium]|nr:hypothetical protein [Candidatus Aminicenantes bacterium]NIM78790.1 hypothetical protein [Candidatus Aminicenantes bacterium]NIN18045.1 hypothetical protein [Candidatus Aminicenantes bacterium]NIN41945.1 hypothetical protein [Candidatus Aminicenantes bacterium]NIN84700.1 hypothetical protein [Candidatus Aminicenantes bacterium]